MTRRRIKRRKEETSSPALELYELAAGTDYDAESEDLETASDSDLEDPSLPTLQDLPVTDFPAEASARPARSANTTLQAPGALTDTGNDTVIETMEYVDDGIQLRVNAVKRLRRQKEMDTFSRHGMAEPEYTEAQEDFRKQCSSNNGAGPGKQDRENRDASLPRRRSTRHGRPSAGSPARTVEQGAPNAFRRRETTRKVRTSRNAYYDEFEEVGCPNIYRTEPSKVKDEDQVPVLPARRVLLSACSERSAGVIVPQSRVSTTGSERAYRSTKGLAVTTKPPRAVATAAPQPWHRQAAESSEFVNTEIESELKLEAHSHIRETRPARQSAISESIFKEEVFRCMSPNNPQNLQKERTLAAYKMFLAGMCTELYVQQEQAKPASRAPRRRVQARRQEPEKLKIDPCAPYPVRKGEECLDIRPLRKSIWTSVSTGALNKLPVVHYTEVRTGYDTSINDKPDATHQQASVHGSEDPRATQTIPDLKSFEAQRAVLATRMGRYESHSTHKHCQPAGAVLPREHDSLKINQIQSVEDVALQENRTRFENTHTTTYNKPHASRAATWTSEMLSPEHDMGTDRHGQRPHDGRTTSQSMLFNGVPENFNVEQPVSTRELEHTTQVVKPQPSLANPSDCRRAVPTERKDSYTATEPTPNATSLADPSRDTGAEDKRNDNYRRQSGLEIVTDWQHDVKIPIFTGKHWSSFKNQFERAARARGWNAETKADYLYGAIQGDAADALGDADSVNWSYEKLISHVGKRHGENKSWADIIQAARNIRRKPRQTLISYYDEIVNLKNQANFRSEHLNTYACYAFLNGLDGDRCMLNDIMPQIGEQSLVEIYNMVDDYEMQHGGTYQQANHLSCEDRGDKAVSNTLALQRTIFKLQEDCNKLKQEQGQLQQAMLKLQGRNDRKGSSTTNDARFQYSDEPVFAAYTNSDGASRTQHQQSNCKHQQTNKRSQAAAKTCEISPDPRRYSAPAEGFRPRNVKYDRPSTTEDEFWRAVSFSCEDLAKAQQLDPDIRLLYNTKLTGATKPPCAVIDNLSEAAQSYFAEWNVIFLDQEGILCRERQKFGTSGTTKQVLLPARHRLLLRDYLHGSVKAKHMGRRRSLKIIQCFYYWHRMTAEIRMWLHACSICQKRSNAELTANRESGYRRNNTAEHDCSRGSHAVCSGITQVEFANSTRPHALNETAANASGLYGKRFAVPITTSSCDGNRTTMRNNGQSDISASHPALMVTEDNLRQKDRSKPKKLRHDSGISSGSDIEISSDEIDGPDADTVVTPTVSWQLASPRLKPPPCLLFSH